MMKNDNKDFTISLDFFTFEEGDFRVFFSDVNKWERKKICDVFIKKKEILVDKLNKELREAKEELIELM